MNEFNRCIKERKLLKMVPNQDIIQREMDDFGYDLVRARESLLNGDHKWASIQAYYCMFHSVKALVLNKGY